MAKCKPTYELAGKGGHCASCYGRIKPGSMEHRFISGGRRVRYHPDCARKGGVLREMPPSWFR